MKIFCANIIWTVKCAIRYYDKPVLLSREIIPLYKQRFFYRYLINFIIVEFASFFYK